MTRLVRGFGDLGRTRVMGVVNVTPDSFSDGGEHAGAAAAVAHGLDLRAQGADLVDVGGESTRPGAQRVTLEEELARVLPVIRALVAEGIIVSVDTSRAEVARAALDAGALMVNDVSAGRDPDLLAVVADAGVAYIAMHSRGSSVDMASRAVYTDVVAEVLVELQQRADAARVAGVAADLLLLDPGLGFAKTAQHNWQLVAALPAFAALAPLVVGASRKAFLGTLLASGPAARSPKGRDGATAALTVLAAQAGAWGVRVHDVASSADAVRVVAAVELVR